MSEIVLEAEPREQLGKNANRRLRRAGRMPAVVYGRAEEALAVSVDPEEVERILRSETGHNTIFQVDIQGRKSNVLIRDFQLHPVRGELIHADFQTIAMDQVMVFEVPLQPEGTPLGVKEGGVLDLVLRQVEVECLPGQVPDHIRIDVSGVEVGGSLRVSDIRFERKGIRIVSDPELVLLTVVPPRVEAAPTVAAEVAAAEAEAAEEAVAEEGKETAPESQEG